ncbi:MAG: carboxylating nicotinate-nucleotide diphosphorylase [Oscillospiraceae bacterium]|nr:carboxylating nicotinate-nucleotide diphosphorylase [Oscillospiraceae bacterium]
MDNFMYDDIILTALKEDITSRDITTDYIIPPKQESAAYLEAKADGIICGIDIAARVFELLGGIEFVSKIKDGDRVKQKDIIAELKGNTRVILKGERTALNILQHLSGIATKSAECAALVSGTRTVICDTRKTLPGLRALQKYAVTVGGGRNHRYNLSDAVLIKDNHIDAAGGIDKAIATVRGKIPHTAKIETETRNFAEVKTAVSSGADIIMLDNFSLDDIPVAISYIRKTDPRILIELSGGITESNLRDYAKFGADIISLGALTHSVTAFDISLKFA